MDTSSHYQNYVKISRSMKVPLRDGLPGFEFNASQVLINLVTAADDIIDDEFQQDMSCIIKNYFTYGRSIFKLLHRTPKSLHKRRLQKLLLKYRIVESTANNLGRKRATSIQQLLMSIPHIAVKLFTFGLHLNHLVDRHILQQLHLTHVSPACLVHYSFSLLPRYEDDADQQFFNIIKAKLLFQFTENELGQEANDDYNRHTNEDKMSRLISRARVIYDSSHICDNSRWFCYRTFFIKEFYTLQPYHYSEAAKIFDSMFGTMDVTVEEVFKLRSGTNKSLYMEQADVDKILLAKESDPMGISSQEIEALRNGFDLIRTALSI